MDTTQNLLRMDDALNIPRTKISDLVKKEKTKKPLDMKTIMKNTNAR